MFLTPEKTIGTKFEIWLSAYLKALGCRDVMFNVEYHKSKNLYRQADVVYSEIIGNDIKKVIVEAKYSSNGPIKFWLRHEKQKAGAQRLTNLVDELVEKQSFAKDAGVYKTVLVTNRHFEDLLIKKALMQGIYLIDGDMLYKSCMKHAQKSIDLERSIRSVDLNRYNLQPNIINIPYK